MTTGNRYIPRISHPPGSGWIVRSGLKPTFFVGRKVSPLVNAQGNPRELARRILALLEPELSREGYSLLDVRIFRGGGRLQIRISVDTPDGITMDEVAAASRTVSIVMDQADLVDDRYVLEVSSPGIRRPLRTRDHFNAVVGQKVDLKVVGGERPARLKGVLTAVRGDTLVIDPPAEDAAPVEVELSRVLEGNLDADFDPQELINADRRRRKEERRADRAKKKSGRKSRPRRKKDDASGNSGA